MGISFKKPVIAVQENPCPKKTKIVDDILKRYASAELESTREGADPESVFWKSSRHPYKGQKGKKKG